MWFSDSEHSRLLEHPAWAGCEETIKSFEQAWQAGERPDLDAYLNVDDAVRPALLVELIHCDFEFRLKAGDAARVEDYLARYPELKRREVTLELLRTEYQLRRRRPGLQFDELLQRFPEYADELRGMESREVRIHPLDRDAAFSLSSATQSLASDLTTQFPLDGRPAQPAKPAEEVKALTLPGYESMELIARGGMAAVYRARDRQLGRTVAIKVLPTVAAQDEARLQRFLHEARTVSGLNHPNICTIHALGDESGRPFIVMEFIEGTTLRKLCKQRVVVSDAIRIVSQVTRALVTAHAAGVVHRDVKPENIMLRDDGYAKVVDFGLARSYGPLGAADESIMAATQPGTILGTVAYMSPEQIQGSPVGSPTDVFSLGLVLYELITGRHPFGPGAPLAMLAAIVNTQPVAASTVSPDVPAELNRLIDSMLQKNPAARPSAEEVLIRLRDIASNRPAQETPAVPTKPVVHRKAELDVLNEALSRADRGEPSMVCVTGEPGIGKTSLVEDFLSGLNATAYLFARGQCSQRLVESEAYVPVLDALQDLRSKGRDGSIVRFMEAVAPSWLESLSPRSSIRAAEPGTPETGQRASSQGAMLKELANFVFEVSRHKALVLFFDDVHWADTATVDLLAYLGAQFEARRATGAPRLLIIATYRPTEMMIGPHTFHATRLELQAKGICMELPLTFWNVDQVNDYLGLAFPDHHFPATLARELHARTEGSPLFVADSLAYLRKRGAITEVDGQWALTEQLPELRTELPESVRGMIQRKLEQLSDLERKLVAAASVLGHEFDSTVLATALDQHPTEMEDCLISMAQVHGLIQRIRDHYLPDGSASQRYRFVHALYQQALYDELSPSRRTLLAKSLAEGLEQHRGNSECTWAAELAGLYEAGRMLLAAAREYQRAALNAAEVYAHHEAIHLARRGLSLLESLPESRDRSQMELALQTTLGLQLQVTDGYASAGARQAYLRARQLAAALDQGPQFPVLWGLWLYYKVSSQLSQAQRLADELLALARAQEDPALALQALQAQGMTALCRGDQAATLRNVEQVATLYDPNRHRGHAALFGQDPGVICKAYGAAALWLLGYPDSAIQQSRLAIAMSEGLSPTSQAVALHFAAMVSLLRGEPKQTLQFAQRAIEIATPHRLSFWQASGKIFTGWAQAQLGALRGGLAQVAGGLDDWRTTGSATYETFYLGLLAQLRLQVDERDEALATVDQAIELAGRTDERFYEAELLRIRGEIMLATISDVGSTVSAEAAADQRWQVMAQFESALDAARLQRVCALELRAAVSLSNAEKSFGMKSDCASRLNEVYASLSEGFDTADGRAAAALLATISNRADSS